jgi:tyrosyl-tRNA synthetase
VTSATRSIAQELEILTSGTVDLLTVEELEERLRRSHATAKPLNIKFGADPSAPDLHVGHTVPIRKLRQFQELGHQVIFLIGDFTARIGDPTGKSETRKPLSADEVAANAKTYLDQMFRILDREKTRVVYNSEWLSRMTFVDVIELSAKYTVARMLERDEYKKRFKDERAIYIHEFLYPLMQGYDSVELHADVELGGTDQKFNLLVGRELQREYGQPPQVVMTLPLLVGLDGENKMSKSLGNYIGITESPDEIFGKAMSIPDTLMPDYLELALGYPRSQVDALMRDVAAERLHPRDLKARIARELTTAFHNADAARAAEDNFNRVFRERALPEEMEEKVLHTKDGKLWLVKMLVDAGLVQSNREARKLILQGAVSLDSEKVTSEDMDLAPGEYAVKIGKRKFARIRLLK